MDIVEELRRDREKGARRLEVEYKAGLMSLARRFGVNDSDAEELVNSTFATVVENIDDYIEQSAFFAWMCQILTSKYSRSIRRKSTQMEVFPGTVPDLVDESAQEAIYSNLDASLLRDAVGQLPEDQREVIILRYFVDMPISKIAKYLSIPSGTVRSRLHYARKALALKMGAKMNDVVKKPGGKAVILALLLCGLTALGAAVWNLAVPGESRVASRMSSSEAEITGHATSDTRRLATGATGGTGATGDSHVPPVTPVPQVIDQSTFSQGEQNMNITTTRTAAMLAAGTIALAASPSAQASMDDWQGNAASPYVVIAVDVDMSLSDALTANNVTLDGAASLVKLGNGTVTVDDASGIGSFSGDIHVFKGGWSVGTAAGFGTPTGTSAGSTWVYPGGCVLITDVTVPHTGETFHLAGTGISDWYGWGAIRFPSSSQESTVMAAGAYGSRWILEDDATVMLATGPSVSGQASFLPAVNLELNGHELTLWRGHYGTIATTKLYGNFNSVTGAGGIVCKNGVQFIDYCFSLPGTAANSIVLQNARLNVWETKAMNTPWRLVARPTPIADWHGNATTQAALMPRLRLYAWGNRDRAGEHDFQIWPGPVTLEGDLGIEMENQSRSQPMTFTNKVTGAGGFAVTTGKAWLYLDCPENDFQGGVTLCGPDDRLVLANDGALPADGGRLLMTNSTVSFPSSVSAPWSLPALELAGASEVRNCQGSWKSVTALDGADAAYNSTLGASNLILKANSKLTVHSLFNPADYAGWEERYDVNRSTTDFDSLPVISTRLYPHYVENNAFRDIKDSNNATRTGTRTIAYATYLWNHNSTNETWTFAGHFGAHIYLWLNDQLICQITGDNSWKTPYRVTGTLHPGANRIVFLSDNNNYGATWDPNNETIGLWAGVNYLGFAYAVGDVPVTDPADFHVPTDPGDGSFCTTKCGDETLDGIAWAPSFQNLAMEADSTLCLDGALSVETAKGAGLVTNGTLTVTRALDVDPTIFERNGGIAVDGDLVFGSGAKVSFADSDNYSKEAAGAYTLATATGTITGFDSSMLELGGKRRCWKVQLINGGKELVLELIPPATTFICK